MLAVAAAPFKYRRIADEASKSVGEAREVESPCPESDSSVWSRGPSTDPHDLRQVLWRGGDPVAHADDAHDVADRAASLKLHRRPQSMGSGVVAGSRQQASRRGGARAVGAAHGRTGHRSASVAVGVPVGVMHKDGRVKHRPGRHAAIPDLVDYVLALARRTHRDRGPEFWRLVERVFFTTRRERLARTCRQAHRTLKMRTPAAPRCPPSIGSARTTALTPQPGRASPSQQRQPTGHLAEDQIKQSEVHERLACRTHGTISPPSPPP